MFHNKNYIYVLLVSLVLLLALVSCGDATNFPSETTAPEPTADVIATVLPDILTTQSNSPTSTLVATQGISAVATGTPTPTLESTTAATSSATELTSKPTQTAKPTEAPTAKPTPTAPSILNAGNGNTNFTETKTVVFSHPSGFYGSKFTLKLGGDSKYTIRYTTNGNEPVSTSKKYSDAEGIKITDKGSMIGSEDKVTVIRAAAFMGTTKVGETVTATYIVNDDYKNFKEYYSNISQQITRIYTEIREFLQIIQSMADKRNALRTLSFLIVTVQQVFPLMQECVFMAAHQEVHRKNPLNL